MNPFSPFLFSVHHPFDSYESILAKMQQSQFSLSRRSFLDDSQTAMSMSSKGKSANKVGVVMDKENVHPNSRSTARLQA